MLNEKIKDNQVIETRHISGDNWKWSIWVLPDGEDVSESSELTLINQRSGKSCSCSIINTRKHSEKGFILDVDLSPLKETIENCKSEKWKVTLSGKDLIDSGRIEEKANKNKDPYRRRDELFEAPAGQIDYAERTVEVIPFCTPGGNWHINVGDKCLRYMPVFRCIGLDSGFRKGNPYFKVSCPEIEGARWTGMVLTYRYRLENDRKDFFFPAGSVTREKKRSIIVTECNIKGLEFKPINWDVRMAFEKDGEQYWCNVTSPDENILNDKDRNGIKSLFSEQSISLTDSSQMSISSTDYGNMSVIVQQPTPYSGFLFRLKERIAIGLFKLMRRNLRKKKIYLVYEKFCSMAQDNGFFFFKYCMDNDMEKRMGSHIYYVIDKKQKDYSKLEPYKDHVIQFMSLRHMIYVLAAKLLISSDSKRHAYAWRATESIIRKKVLKEKKSVFLQHGVFGLKRSDEFKRGTGGGTNLFIASNEMEKGFIVDDMDYKPEQVVVTGLPRWDVLEDKSEKKKEKHILVMPTWRKWLEETTDEIFFESEYYKKYMELINSEEISKFLDKHDLYMDFYIHPKFSEQIKQFSTTSERVNLIPFGTEPLNELMMECKLLITDYSSVCWDVYYQGKPVIFYQFDLAKYNEVQGAYMDLEKDLFGDRAETQAELLVFLEEEAYNGFELKPEYSEMREGMYKYIDHNNSKRICEEIMQRGW